MHAKLSKLLPDDVCNALDTSAGTETNARAKLQRSCRNTDLAMVLDYTTSVAFTHHSRMRPATTRTTNGPGRHPSVSSVTRAGKPRRAKNIHRHIGARPRITATNSSTL